MDYTFGFIRNHFSVVLRDLDVNLLSFISTAISFDGKFSITVIPNAKRELNEAFAWCEIQER